MFTIVCHLNFDVDGIKGLLEEIGVVDVSEEGDGVGQHPNVPAPAVVVRFRPLAILVPHRQDFVFFSLCVRVCRFVQRVRVETWGQVNTGVQ